MTRSKKPVFITVLVVVLIAALASIFWNLHEPAPPPPDPRPLYEAGDALADETARLLANKGTVVVLAPDTEDANLYLAAFEKIIQQQKNMQLKAVERVKVEQLRKGHGRLESALFFDLLRKHSNADAVVSFLGLLPDLKPEDLPTLGEHRPKFLANAPSGIGVKKLFDQGILDVAIVRRPPPTLQSLSNPPKVTYDPDGRISPRSAFEANFMIVTADSDHSQITELGTPPVR